MALQKQTAEFPFGGLDQKTHAIFKEHGMLEDAENVIYDKKGKLQKRRGYDRMGDAATIFGATVEATFHACAVFQGELLIFSTDKVYAVVDKDATRALVERGPNIRGAIRRQIVTTSNLTAL